MYSYTFVKHGICPKLWPANITISNSKWWKNLHVITLLHACTKYFYSKTWLMAFSLLMMIDRSAVEFLKCSLQQQNSICNIYKHVETFHYQNYNSQKSFTPLSVPISPLGGQTVKTATFEFYYGEYL